MEKPRRGRPLAADDSSPGDSGEVGREVLLITDDMRRGQRLARDLETVRSCRVLDLYGDVQPTCGPGLIVSDVSTLNSDAILRLRRMLGAVRSDETPYLFLVHGNAARAQAQAQVLGASGTLDAGAMTQALLAALKGLDRHEDPVVAAAVRHAGAACRFLGDVFVAGRPVTPAVIDTGTGLIARAVQEIGIRDWIREVQRFDDTLHQHCLLVAGLAAAFARGLGFGSIDRHRLVKAALLHDIGKVHVPIDILNKPGPLTPTEMRAMRMHPTYGHDMLVGHGFEDVMLAVVRSHHELLDGSGYPDGLEGDAVPDIVRLVTICDIYAALIERRSYKPPMRGAKAYTILDGMAGRLDRDFVRAFHPIATVFDGFGSRSSSPPPASAAT